MSTPSQPLMDLDLIRSFVTIAECEGMTRAAKKLHRTPGALSQQMKRLEEMLETELLVREPRRVYLTADGESLLRLGRQMLKLNSEAMAFFVGHELEGEVRLGLPEHLGTRVLPNALSQFARSHPSVTVDVVLGKSIELAERFDTGDLDLFLASSPMDRMHVPGVTVFQEQLVWTGRDGGIACQQRPLPVSVAERGCTWREAALNALEQADTRFRIAYSSDTSAGQEAAMLADIAVAPYPASLLKAPLKRLPTALGLPPLKPFDITMYVSQEAGDATSALASYIRDLYPSPALDSAA